jgi:hypothetical protein
MLQYDPNDRPTAREALDILTLEKELELTLVPLDEEETSGSFRIKRSSTLSARTRRQESSPENSEAIVATKIKKATGRHFDNNLILEFTKKLTSVERLVESLQNEYDITLGFEEPQIQSHLKPLRRGGNTKILKLKLLLGELGANDENEALTAMKNNLMSVTAKALKILNAPVSKYGAFNLGLAVGSRIVDWDEKSLVMTKPLSKAPNYVLAIDLAQYEGEEITEVLAQIAQVIVMYNTSRTYDQVTCNGHTFIDELCQVISVRIDTILEGAVGQKLFSGERFRSTYAVPEEIRGHFKNYKYIMFTSHKQLDEFMYDLLSKKLPYFETLPGKQDVSETSSKANLW